MKRNTYIQLKAALLLAVFGLNTLVGFACAVGVDMSFNSFQHNEEVPDVHVHADGTKHEHHKEPIVHHDENGISKNDKKGCCKDDVIKFHSLDKNLNQNAKTAVNPPVFAAIRSIFISIDILKASGQRPLNIHRHLFPRPPDILISIHRFQI